MNKRQSAAPQVDLGVFLWTLDMFLQVSEKTTSEDLICLAHAIPSTREKVKGVLARRHNAPVRSRPWGRFLTLHLKPFGVYLRLFAQVVVGVGMDATVKFFLHHLPQANYHREDQEMVSKYARKIIEKMRAEILCPVHSNDLYTLAAIGAVVMPSRVETSWDVVQMDGRVLGAHNLTTNALINDIFNTIIGMYVPSINGLLDSNVAVQVRVNAICFGNPGRTYDEALGMLWGAGETTTREIGRVQFNGDGHFVFE